MSSHFSKSKKGLPGFKTGFTLVEMIVVISIFLITTVIILSNFKGFTRKSSLDLLAREMSLVIRQAQVYGTATRRYGDDTSSEFPSYGVYFKSAGEGNTNFILFGDKGGSNSNKKYDTDELVEQFNLTGGVYISSVAGDGCSASCDINAGLNVIFTRPAPGAVFTDVGGVKQDYSNVIITLKDPGIVDTTPDQSLSTRQIYIWNTGHIYVKSEL